MTNPPEHTIAIEVVAVLDTGLWCNRCLLSTGLRGLLALTRADDMTLHERRWCIQCASRDVTG